MAVHKKDLRLEGSGGREEWPIGHVGGRPAIHLVQTDLAKSVKIPFCPYISTPYGRILDNTLY
jgi:hypothetical protein